MHTCSSARNASFCQGLTFKVLTLHVLQPIASVLFVSQSWQHFTASKILSSIISCYFISSANWVLIKRVLIHSPNDFIAMEQAKFAWVRFFSARLAWRVRNTLARILECWTPYLAINSHLFNVCWLQWARPYLRHHDYWGTSYWLSQHTSVKEGFNIHLLPGTSKAFALSVFFSTD